MAYEEDPAVVAYSRRFEETPSGYAFSLAGTDFALSVTEEEYLAGLYRMQTFASLTKMASIAISIAALSAILVPFMQGRWSAWSILLFLSGGIVRLSGTSLSLWLSWLPFRQRILREVREKRGWKRRGLFAGAKVSGIPVAIWTITVGLSILTGWVVIDHNRRLDLLKSGQPALAEVTFSGMKSGRNSHCQVDFRLSVAGIFHEGSTTQCSIMERQNTGSLLPVRFDPTAPASVVAEGDSTWDALVVVPILMWPILLIVFVFGWLPFVVGYEPRRAVKVNDELF